MMKPWACGLLMFALAASSHAADAVSGASAQMRAGDRELAKQLATELKAALTTAMQISPESAIAVCNERAPQIAARISAENAVSIGRTALRVRNPSNAPNDWQREVLAQFEQRRAAGEALATMEYSAAVQEGGYTEHRYMKAIATEPLCVACHGQQMTPELKRAIAAKYPNDAATGFNAGDLRGAVYIVRREPASSPAAQ